MKLSRIILALAVISATPVMSSEAIGTYSSGKLKESESIIERGTRIHKLFLARKRFFGTVQIQDVISDAADFVRQEIPEAELLQIGDIANENGGACAGHGSHQNGLDADIVYLTNSRRLQSPTAPHWDEEFVKSGKMTSNVNIERNLKLFKFLVTTQPVQRIFVDAAIKKEFCAYAKKNNLMNDRQTLETLRRLRVEKLHSTHFHMRLKCPEEDLACKKQAEVPLGSGC